MARRVWSFVIDSFVIASILAIIVGANVPEWFWVLKYTDKANPILTFSLPSIGFVLVLLIFMLKDLLFLNASIGKMVLGLRIVDADLNRPSILKLIKRQLCVYSIGLIVFAISKPLGKDYAWLKDLEIKHCGTQVLTLKEIKTMRHKQSEEQCHP